jgi:hypothetical protein
MNKKPLAALYDFRYSLKYPSLAHISSLNQVKEKEKNRRLNKKAFS